MVAMADYQFQPDILDPIAQLRLAMDRMDGRRRQDDHRNCADIKLLVGS